jgi:hypothetical protein
VSKRTPQLSFARVYCPVNPACKHRAAQQGPDPGKQEEQYRICFCNALTLAVLTLQLQHAGTTYGRQPCYQSCKQQAWLQVQPLPWCRARLGTLP